MEKFEQNRRKILVRLCGITFNLCLHIPCTGHRHDLNKKYFSIYAYGIASTATAVYIIGGYPDNRDISKYENHYWTTVGELTHQRKFHAAIAFKNEFFILGGRLNVQHNYTGCNDW